MSSTLSPSVVQPSKHLCAKEFGGRSRGGGIARVLKANESGLKVRFCKSWFHWPSQSSWREIIEIVQNYTYLGTRISSSRNFTLSLEHLRQKAVDAFFGLRRHIDFNKLIFSLACKIFDSMMSPILTYNSEVWGAFAKSDFK